MPGVILGWVHDFGEILSYTRAQRVLTLHHKEQLGESVARVLMDECRINLIIERPDGVSKDIQEIFAAMGKQPWYRLRIRTGGKDGKAD